MGESWKRLEATGLLVLALSTALCARPRAASAEDKDDCLAAFEQTQLRRRAGKLLSAREATLVCARDVCISAIRNECVRWLEELDANIPSIVMEAEVDGETAFDVRVSLDGNVIAERLEGKPMQFDPGKMTLKFEAANLPPVNVNVITRYGERNRVVVARFARAPAVVVAPPLQSVPPETNRPVPWPVLALGAVAVLGGAGFAYFGLKGKAQESADQTTCAPFCTKAEGNSVNAQFLLADVFVGVGSAALGTGLVWYLVRPEKRLPPTTTVNIKPALGGATLAGRF